MELKDYYKIPRKILKRNQNISKKFLKKKRKK